MFRVGIVEAGDIAGKVYLPLLSADPDIEIVCLASRTRSRAEALARRYRLEPVLCDVHMVLKRKPDIVFIHTSTSSHANLVRACLEAGLHVYVDKPLSESLDEAVRLASLADQRNLLLAVGFNRRFAPMIRAAIEAVPEPTLVLAEKHRKSPQSKSAYSTVYDDFIHALDLVCWAGSFTSEPEVRASMLVGDGRLITVTAGLSRPGLLAQASMTRDAGEDLERFYIAGHRVSAAVTDLDAAIVHQAGLSSTRSFGSWDDVLTRRGFTALVRHVLESLDMPGSCEVSATAVLPTHRVADQIARGAGR